MVYIIVPFILPNNSEAGIAVLSITHAETRIQSEKLARPRSQGSVVKQGFEPWHQILELVFVTPVP